MPFNFDFINRHSQFGFVNYEILVNGDLIDRFSIKIKQDQDNPSNRNSVAQNFATALLQQKNREARRKIVVQEVTDTLMLAYGILIIKTLNPTQINNLITNLDNVLTAIGFTDVSGIKPPAYNKVKDSLIAIINFINSDGATLNQLNNIENMANDMVIRLNAL